MKSISSTYAPIDWQKASNLFIHLPPPKKSLAPTVKTVLPYIAAAGAVGIIFAFPGIAPAIGGLALAGRKWRSEQMLNRISKSKLIKKTHNPNGTITVVITKKGMLKALTYHLDTLVLKKPKKWDDKWRLVIFDIPNKYKKIRDIFRFRISQMGLLRLQESTYVAPYPCFEEIEFLRQLYGIRFTVCYIVAEKIEDDEILKEHFSLI